MLQAAEPRHPEQHGVRGPLVPVTAVELDPVIARLRHVRPLRLPESTEGYAASMSQIQGNPDGQASPTTGFFFLASPAGRCVQEAQASQRAWNDTVARRHSGTFSSSPCGSSPESPQSATNGPRRRHHQFHVIITALPG